MSDQDAWRYAQEMRLEVYENVEPPRPTMQEWARNVRLESGRYAHLPSVTALDWEPGRFERPNPNMTPASPFAYNPFRDMPREIDAYPQLPTGDDLQQYMHRQPPRNGPPTPRNTSPPPRTSPPPATLPPESNDLWENMHRQPPRNAAPPPTPRTAGPAPAPGVTPQPPNAPQPPTGRMPPIGGGTPPPPTAAPRIPIPPNNPTPGARPSNVPAPRGGGMIAGGAIGAGADFTWRIFQGQDPKVAAGGALVGTGGSIAGGIIGGMIGGPVGSFVGSMVGGAIAGTLYNHLTAPKPAQPPPQGYNGPEPFHGGQCFVYYDVYYHQIYYQEPYQENNVQVTRNFRGPISGARLINGGKTLQVYAAGYSSDPSTRDTPNWYNVQDLNEPRNTVYKLVVDRVQRQDGQPDNCGNPQPLPLPKDDRTPDSTYHPGNIVYIPYRADPDKSAGPAPTNYVPGGIGSRTGGTPRGDSPNWVPHGGPAGTPHPNTIPPPVAPTPAPIPPGSPNATGAPPSDAPAPNRHGGSVRFDPDSGRVTFTTPGSPTNASPTANPHDQAVPPAFEANPLTANPIKPQGLTPTGFTNNSTPGQPAGLPQTGRQERTSDGTRDYPLTPQPQPQTQNQTQNQNQNEPRFKEIEDKIDEIALVLVGLTQAFAPVPGRLTNIQDNTTNIQNNTTPQAIQNAAAAGTCQTLQPGGCMVPLANNAANAANNSNNAANAANNAANNAAANNNILNRIMALLQGIDLTLLATINSKLGAAMPGGLSGGLSRLSRFLGIDRALNLLNFLATVHNAIMLSNGLKETLLTTLSSVGNATGLLETSEGENVDLNQVANQGFEMLMIKIFGAEVWAGIETNWRKHNRIYQAAANVTNAVSNMMNAIANGIEAIGERAGKIGNALKAAAQVPENAYQWFSEKMNVRGSKYLTFETKVGQTTAFLNVINEVAQNVVEGQQAYTEAVKATKEFNEEMKKAEKEKGAENELIKKEAEENKKLATKDPTGAKEKGLLSFLTNTEE